MLYNGSHNHGSGREEQRRKIVVQVEKVVADGTLDPKLVKIPGIYVDAVVEAEDMKDHEQCVGCDYDGAMTGDFRIPLSSLEYPPLSAKRSSDGELPWN